MKGKNVEVTEALEEYAEEKLGRLERLLDGSATVELELAEERNPSISRSQVAEATVRSTGPVMRARESSEDMRASIDLLSDKLERQVKRYREKRQGRRSVAQRGEDPAPGPGGGLRAVAAAGRGEPTIVKTKQFAVKPMTAEEAVLQLELIGHDFFVFRNVESDGVNVVYRRRDGNYGLIEPLA